MDLELPVLRDTPSEPAPAVLVLGHGAGSPMTSPFMQGIAESLLQRGLEIVRFDFPYMAAGRRAPGNQSHSEEAFRSVADHVRDDRPLILGGKSYGGRIASHLAASGYPVSGLVFLGYPLHPPGRPEKVRDAHLPDVAVPMLFLQGTRDAFARADLLQPLMDRLPQAKLVEVQGGDHSFAVRGRGTGDVLAELAAHVDDFVRALLEPSKEQT